MGAESVAGDPAAVETKPVAFTRRQRTALASCYWQPCRECKRTVPVLRGVGSPAAGFKRFHAQNCGAA